MDATAKSRIADSSRLIGDTPVPPRFGLCIGECIGRSSLYQIGLRGKLRRGEMANGLLGVPEAKCVTRFFVSGEVIIGKTIQPVR
jgi:hypothetical protein